MTGILGWGALLALLGVILTGVFGPKRAPDRRPTPEKPVRAEPDTFPPNTHLPPAREASVCGSIDLSAFSPESDLVRVEDNRVWWESDHDTGDDEDDHIVHRLAEGPLRRLIDLVEKNGGRLKVQDAYRPKGVHIPSSLHKEGRAIDVTCEGLSLEKLARLCWAAGFDWVYHEAKRPGNEHVHCSVKREK
ncbi:MAG: hypothetical protein R6V03_01520 [Kiritimatiellia bacterium]